MADSATFIGQDNTTRGDWVGVYGATGYYKLEGGSNTLVSSLPSGVTITNPPTQRYAFESPTTDPRGVRRAPPNQATRDASCWYDVADMSFTVTSSDSAVRRVRVLLIDWNNAGRGTRVDVISVSGASLLDTRTVPAGAAHTAGVWLSWEFTGTVRLKLNCIAGANTTAFMLAFDAPAPPDTTAPTVASASVDSAGTTLAVTFSESVTGGAGFSIPGKTLGSASGTGSTRTYSVTPAVTQGASTTLAYTPGNVADAAGNPLAAFSGQAVTNNSTVAPPLAAGSASFVSAGPGGISVSATAPAGGSGSGPAYQWERNADGGAYADLPGATSLPLSDATATAASVLYGYRCKQTRGAETVTTNTITAQPYQGGPLSGPTPGEIDDVTAAQLRDEILASLANGATKVKLQAGTHDGATIPAVAAVANVSGDVAGKVLGGGLGTITGTGVNARIGDVDPALYADGTAQAGAASTITLASSASTADDAYNGRSIAIVAGAGQGQGRKIVDYAGSTRVATVDAAWATPPDSTSKYALGDYGASGVSPVPTDGSLLVTLASKTHTGATIPNVTTTATATNLANLPAPPDGWITAAALASGALAAIRAGLSTLTAQQAAAAVLSAAFPSNPDPESLAGILGTLPTQAEFLDSFGSAKVWGDVEMAAFVRHVLAAIAGNMPVAGGAVAVRDPLNPAVTLWTSTPVGIGRSVSGLNLGG